MSMVEAVATQTRQANQTQHAPPSTYDEPDAGPATRRLPINELQPGSLVNDLYVVSDLQLRKGGKTGSFVTFRAADATGTVRGVFWPQEPDEAEVLIEQLEGGGLARINGDVVSYRDRTEIRVAAPTGGMSAYEGRPLDPEPFVAASPVSERELRDAVEVRIGLVSDKHLRRLLRAFFADKERADAYFRLPARLQGAHSHLRGLAEEAIEAARIVGAAAGSIPDVDRDLVTTAALLAPAGAILAYDELGLAHEPTRPGLLMPHRVLAADLALQAAREASHIPAGKLQRLRHVIVREADVPRWGWASGPDALMSEAVVLHHALEMSRTVPEVAAAFQRRTADMDI